MNGVRSDLNSSSGVTGVTLTKGGKWLAYIRVNYQRIDLGRFAAMEDAIACRKAAEITHGFHANHGRAA